MSTAGLSAPEVAAALEIGEIVVEAAWPYIQAYFEPPQWLADLNSAAKNPQPGYEVHHIVEQATAAADGSEQDLMTSPENLVRIPTLKHWELNAWYATANPRFEYQSPRQYLVGKSWEERRLVGLEGLREVGVLHEN